MSPQDHPAHGYDLWSATADYPTWNGPPRRTLIVCTQHRSGSSLLGEAIHFAGDLGCPVEYFHGGVRPLFEARWKTDDFSSYLDQLYRFRTAPSGVFSAKIVWFDIVDLVCQLSPGEFDILRDDGPVKPPPQIYSRVFAVLRDIFPNPTWIRLTRQNTMEQAVSHFIAWQTLTWRQLADQESTARPPYDFDEICQTLGRIQSSNLHWANFFRANGLPHHDLTYEDMAKDYETALRRFFADIGDAAAPIPPPRLRKQADAYSQTLLKMFLEDFHRRTQA